MIAPLAVWLSENQKLHLQHGPIDLIVTADGRDAARAFAQAQKRFHTILDELCTELPMLRRQLTPDSHVTGSTARRMKRAVQRHSGFVTPMAAVAGAVADEVLGAMCTGCNLTKASVNNGGDVAFYLGVGQEIKALSPAGEISIKYNDISRGLATSGWRGRSHSLGIADAVTVAARTAAEADVAATLIANAVDLPNHANIQRTPANNLSPDSDLGARLVTTHVGDLSRDEVQIALTAGLSAAEHMQSAGLIHAALLSLNGQTRMTASQISTPEPLSPCPIL